LVGKLFLPNRSSSTEGASIPASFYGRASSALQHGAEDHLALLILMLFIGLTVGAACSRLRVLALPIILVASALVFTGAARFAWAHEGQDQTGTGVATPGGDLARRLPSGQVFVPKPTQRILDIRTATAKTEKQPKAIVLVGRVITNPNRSGMVQSIEGGRVTAPDHGFPRLGQRVAKGDVLASVERPMPIADRTTISERLGELEQLIAMAETKLKRLRPLAERNAVPQSQVIDAETELEGLFRRRDVLRETRVAPEILRASIDGVVALSNSFPARSSRPRTYCFRSLIPRTFGSRPTSTAAQISKPWSMRRPPGRETALWNS
jgi:membrane fusion protein, heavy metal efflux system